MNDVLQTAYGGALSAQRNRVLRNTYWLLALSMVPTVLGAWLEGQTGILSELARDELADTIRLTEAINALAARIGERVRGGLGSGAAVLLVPAREQHAVACAVGDDGVEGVVDGAAVVVEESAEQVADGTGGEQLDWQKLRGKIVILDFWSTPGALRPKREMPRKSV